jgi:hypothetical protein
MFWFSSWGDHVGRSMIIVLSGSSCTSLSTVRILSATSAIKFWINGALPLTVRFNGAVQTQRLRIVVSLMSRIGENRRTRFLYSGTHKETVATTGALKRRHSSFVTKDRC